MRARLRLGQHGFEMRDPKNGSITVYREVTRRKGVLLKRTIEHDRMCNIAYRGETQPVGLPDIRLVRKVCQLDQPHGYESRAFYKSDDPVDIWINDCRSALEKLSKE